MQISWGISFLAGALTTLSPCVLPILPLVLGSALKRHPLAPVAIAFGLSLTFVLIGWTIAAFGSVFGIDAGQIRFGAGVVLLLSGILSLLPKVQDAISALLAPVSDAANDSAQKISADKATRRADLVSAFFTGMLLGVIWSPCSGPTLGAAIALATSSGGGLSSGVSMFIFAIGAATPLVVIAYGARSLVQRKKAQVMRVANIAKKVFAYAMIVVGLAILFGLDKSIEAALVSRMSDSWVDFTSKY